MVDYFKRSHPLVLFSYFILNMVLIMIERHPIVIVLQFLSLLYITRGFNKYYIFMILLITITNPIFVHRGNTVLFYLYYAYTLEALIYGFIFSLLLINVFLLFSLMNKVMNSEHYIYLFSNHFPHIGLLISMIFSLIPRYIEQFKAINMAQRQFYKNTFKRLMVTFSIMVTWAFETSLNMLESMYARGYGTGKRTHFHLFYFTNRDLIHLIEVIVLFILGIIGYYLYFRGFYYYPIIILNRPVIYEYIFFIVFMINILIPVSWEERSHD